MPDTSDLTKSVIDEEERKRLIQEIEKIKDVLDSFKYGLNFEDFADELFKAIDRLTVAMKGLENQMENISNRMEMLEKQLKDGIKVRVAGLSGETTEGITPGKEVVIEEPITIEEPTPEEIEEQKSKEELEKEAEDIKLKIARLFEKENELAEMAMNDPAGADEYEDKARVAREMRTELEARLKKINEQL